VIEQLHRGDYAIQAHLNLHGFSVPQARIAFVDFLNEAIATGKRAVLVVHGRGRSSRDRPVIKAKVQQWLSKSRWKKWLLAYASARPCDGGAGATYVLLRQRPCKKAAVKHLPSG
jgi:DNA-nicking Smr family endonuclease